MNLNWKDLTKKLKIQVPSRKTVLLIVVVAIVAVAFSTLVAMWLEKYHNYRVPSIGTIHALGFDAFGGNLTTQNGTQQVDWGTVYVGGQMDRSLFLRSKSNIDTTMNLTAANWTYTNTQGHSVTPPTTNYLTLTWDYNNSTIKPNQEIQVTLTLSASNETNFIEYLITNNVTQFSFDIHIYPSQT